MMEVITLSQDQKVGYNTPWWPEHSSGSYSVRIKGYLIDVAVSYGALGVAADGDAVGRALAPPMSGEKMYICLATPGAL